MDVSPDHSSAVRLIAAAAASGVVTALACWLSSPQLQGPSGLGGMTLLQKSERKPIGPPPRPSDAFWGTIQSEARDIIASTGGLDAEAALMSCYVSESITKWDSIEEALANHLAEKLGTAALPAAKWRPVLTRVLSEGKHASGLTLGEVVQKDLETIRDRDPACPSFAHAFLHFKGFLGLQAQRASHWLWTVDEKRPLASLIQARVSETFGMDIHPAARIGVGVLMDHATGVVIGETAAVGDGCTLLHGVTLGGTGKETEDRHPKLGKNVLVGAGSSILGNVKIGDGAKIGAAALVLTDIPAHATAVGSPAKVVGRSKEDSPAAKMDQICKNVYLFPTKGKWFCPFRQLDVAKKGSLSPQDVFEKLKQKKIDVSISDVVEIFWKLDTDHNGEISEQEFKHGYDQFMATLQRHGSVNTLIAKLGCEDHGEDKAVLPTVSGASNKPVHPTVSGPSNKPVLPIVSGPSNKPVLPTVSGASYKPVLSTLSEAS